MNAILHLRRYVVVVVVLCALAAACAMQPARRAGLDRVQHIIGLYAENRSFDSLYGLWTAALAL